MSTEQENITKPCCPAMADLIPTFGWFRLNNITDEDVLLMPYIESKGIKYRINHCPSCGKYIRNIKIPDNEFKQYFL